MKIPLVAIIGLPNSGKSTFFNKVLERRAALTYPEAGTTRDRAYGLTSWNGLTFYLIDTAGLVPHPTSDLEKNVQKQTAIAKAEADLILLLVDGQTPLGSEDLRMGAEITQSRKPWVLAVNKIDARNAKTQSQAEAYQKLGTTPFLMSSVNGSGVGDVLDEIVAKLNSQFAIRNSQITDSGLRIAFVGRPNVGKSSLINALLKQERLLVHESAGTTRSTVEVPFEFNDRQFLLLDTAGIKKRWDQDSDVEAAAAFQSIRTINQTDVALFVLDATSEIQVADQTIAEQILEQGKACVILLNKIDRVEKTEQSRLLDKLPDYLPQMWYVPVLFTSALTGQGLDLLLKFALDAAAAAQRQVPEADLDGFLQKTIAENMPGKMEDQRAPKLYNLKQIGVTPPTFKLTVNFPAAIATAWKKWFEKQFRLKFGFEGTPIEIKYIRKV